MMNRRKFVKNTLYTGALIYLNRLPAGIPADETVSITILHTNDVHSRVDPFPMDGSRNAGQGGVAKRASMIENIRNTHEHILLLDAGDIFQGTPYFNLFGGEVEIKLMSKMGYDAATIGNHDFDGGIDGLVKQLPHANFPFIVSNYRFEDTPLYGRTVSSKIFKFQEVKIGIYGLGIELRGLVPLTLYGRTKYVEPVGVMQKIESFLKKDRLCDYIICLSHLGYRYRNDKVSDVIIAQNSRYTDLIIGGHTHTFMKNPHIEKNLNGHPVMINQVGFAGILLGKVDVNFERTRKRKRMKSEVLIVE